MDKENVVCIYIIEDIYKYVYNRILLAIKKKDILPFATWMDFEGIMLSEISQTERDKYCMMLLQAEMMQSDFSHQWEK